MQWLLKRQSCWGTKPHVRGRALHFYVPDSWTPLKNPISHSLSLSLFVSVKPSAAAICVVEETQALPAGAARCIPYICIDWSFILFNRANEGSFLSVIFELVFSWCDSPWGLWTQAASFHLGMKSSVMHHQIFSYGKNSSLLKDFLVWWAFLSKVTFHMPTLASSGH